MSGMQEPSDGYSLFVSNAAEPAGPTIKVENNGQAVQDAATPRAAIPAATRTRSIQAPSAARETPAAPVVNAIDIDSFKDAVYIKTLDKFCEKDDVFATIRAAYKKIFLGCSALIVGARGKKESDLKKLLHDTGLAVGGSSKSTFRDRYEKHWPAILGRAKTLLGEEVKRVEVMDDEFVDPGEEAAFRRIVGGRRHKLTVVEKGIQRACDLVADLEKALKW